MKGENIYDRLEKKKLQQADVEERYAIYYAPEEGFSLEEFGRFWLGRDACSGKTFAQPSVEGISPQLLSDIVSVAARYGFHGTLKPPFFIRKPVLNASA